MKILREIWGEITKRFFYLKEIKEQANLFNIISENSDDVIWIYDLDDKKFTYISPSIQKLRGFTPQEALKQSFLERISPESKQYVEEQLPRRIAAIEKGDLSLKTAKDRIVQLHKDGTSITTEVITNFVIDKKGKASKIIGITRDISETVVSEEKLKNAFNDLTEKYTELNAVKEELKISRDYIKNVLDSVNDAILIFEINRDKLIDVNKRMCNLFGYSHMQAVKLKLEDISLNKAPYSSEEIKEWFKKTKDEGNQTFEWIFKKNDGNTFWGEISLRLGNIGNDNFIVATVRDINEQKNITLALQENKNKLQSVLDTSLDAITLTNNEGIFLACNKTLLKRWDKTRSEMINHSAGEFLPPEIFADRLQKTKECIYKKTNIHFIDNYRNHYFENTISPIIETDGSVKSVALFSRDITDKKLAQLKLQNEHDFLVNILESMTDAFISIDKNMLCTYMNQNAGKIFGCIPEEIIGKNILLEFPEEIGQFLLMDFEKALEDHVYSQAEIFYTPYNRWFEQRIFPSNNGLAIFFQDISERKKVLRSIEESEARYRFLFENNPLPMLVYERITFRMLAVNEAFTIHYGYTLDEVRSLLLTDLYPEDEKVKIMKVASGLKGHANVGEWHHIKKDGTVITIIAQSHDLDYMGKSARVAVLTDITDRKLVEMEILKLNKELENRVIQRTSQLETAYKDMESFSYSVSHDLRAPLRAITGFSEIIARRYFSELNSEVQHYLDNILRASKKMGQLIDDLLIYSRLGRQGVTLIPIQLSQVLESVENDFTITLNEINGTFKISKELPAISGDKSLLNRIFTNLIENAIKYRKPDVPIIINISAQCKDDKVVVYVNDNGIGIPPEHHKRIFNIFQRLHSDEKYPGTGIGLATVKRSLELLNGTIYVESEPGKGSTFIIELFKGTL